MAWSIPANWLTFEAAKNALLMGIDLPEGHKQHFDGIGFFISREKDVVLDIYAVDLDHCRNPENGEMETWAKDVLSRLNSYSEVSPSGTGVHTFVRGMLPEGSKNTNDQMKDKNRIEVFTDKHHITITGDRLLEYPETIEDRSEIITEIYNEVIDVKASKKAEKKQNKIRTKRIIYDCKAEAQKKYVAAAIEDELKILEGTSESDRNNQLNRSAFAIGQFVGAHLVSRREAERELQKAARKCGMDERKDGVNPTIRSGLDDGELNPREIPDQEETIQAPLPTIIITTEEPKEKSNLTITKTIQKEEKESTATVLVNLAIKNSFECWHTPDGAAYITIPINSHREHYPISTKATKIRAWLGRLGRDMIGSTPSVSSIRDAINNLIGIAVYDGKEYQMYVRKAEIDGKIYVDLGDTSWRAVEVSEDGWKIIENCDIRFKRSKNMLPLPLPERGGEIDNLKSLINAGTDENWILTLAWLSQAFWCRGPYAHLYLRGTQGTAKSYMMQTLKSISDPSAAIKRRLPKSERDAAIAIGSESVPCFDNMSGIDDDIADLLCVASTGGVSSKRANYTDDEESIINIKCPIIANGIEDLGQRGDLLDRTIVLDLEPIPEEERRTEKEMQAAIDENRSKLFACLLDLTVNGLNNIDTIELEKPPRMADFAEWACACLGDAANKFIEIYAGSREDIKQDLVDANVFPRAVRKFATNYKLVWMGTASQLLEALNSQEHIVKGYEPRDWPQTANQLGSELRRHIPDLESSSIMIKFSKSHKKAREITIWYKDDANKKDDDRPLKIDISDEGDKGDNTFSKEEKEEKRESSTIETSNLKVSNNPCPLVPHDPDSDSGRTTKGDNIVPTSNEIIIKIAAMQEYGINGQVDARKIAANLKIVLYEVTDWLDENYDKTDTGRYVQRKSKI